MANQIRKRIEEIRAAQAIPVDTSQCAKQPCDHEYLTTWFDLITLCDCHYGEYILWMNRAITEAIKSGVRCAHIHIEDWWNEEEGGEEVCSAGGAG